jgi:hypothetical protein
MTSSIPLAVLADRVKGYPKLAGQIELRPETAIFRRFGALNAENLLYFQAELVLLEEELREQQLADSLSNHPRRSKYALSWYQLSTSEEDGDAQQLRLVFRIRETLRLYSMSLSRFGHEYGEILTKMADEALVQQAKILAYPEPHLWDLTHVQHFLHNKEDLGLSLRGPDATVWGSVSQPKKHSPDLITLCPRPKEDPFSGWVLEKTLAKLFLCGCTRFMKPSKRHGVIGFEDIQVLKVTYWITSILASLIPIASIVVLYLVHAMPARLGVIGAFNVLISVCLVGFTEAKRSEVFAITAA